MSTYQGNLRMRSLRLKYLILWRGVAHKNNKHDYTRFLLSFNLGIVSKLRFKY